MAGGVGSRFWPLSRRQRPKQLLDLFGGGTMVRRTVDRLLPLVPAERQVIVTGEVLGQAMRQALPELPNENVLEEPMGRNTAPAIAWAAREIPSEIQRRCSRSSLPISSSLTRRATERQPWLRLTLLRRSHCHPWDHRDPARDRLWLYPRR